MRRVSQRAGVTVGEGGVTFTEVLVVLVLLGTLALVAVPAFFVPDTLEAYAVSRELATDLRRTRRLAITQHTNYTLEFSPATAPYTSYTVFNASTLAVEPDFPKQIPTTATVTGTRTITFIPNGCICPTATPTDAVVDVAVGGALYRLTGSWYTGRIRVERVP